MARITTIETGLYRIPLTVTLSDSAHGEITAFELVTCLGAVEQPCWRCRRSILHYGICGAARRSAAVPPARRL